jgi:type IV fimbrial biogenesis protein FimT
MLVTRRLRSIGSVRRIALPACARGFTLVELLTVLVIVAIGAIVAMPSLSQALVTQRLRAAATDLSSSLMLARSEAIKRGTQVQLAPVSASNWTSGWLVTGVGTGDQIDRKDKLGDDVVVSRAPGTIVYDRTGRLSTPGVVRLQFSDAGGSSFRTSCISIDPSGLPRRTSGACP